MSANAQVRRHVNVCLYICIKPYDYTQTHTHITQNTKRLVMSRGPIIHVPKSTATKECVPSPLWRQRSAARGRRIDRGVPRAHSIAHGQPCTTTTLPQQFTRDKDAPTPCFCPFAHQMCMTQDPENSPKSFVQMVRLGACDTQFGSVVPLDAAATSPGVLNHAC